MADVIPIEIWLNHIFTRLPVKSILCCKRICKAWNRVLCDPEFVRMHLLHQDDHNKLFIQTCYFWDSYQYHFYSVDHEASGGADAVKLNFSFPVEEMRIMGSSNGLLCVLVIYLKNEKIYYTGKETLVIWNPSTGDFKLIPDGPSLYPTSQLGFGYDSSINDGKIVCFTSFDPKIPGQPITSRVDIYSMKSNSWKLLENYDAPFSLAGLHALGIGCAVNGSIYWLVDIFLRNRGLQLETDFPCILRFNIENNKFRKVKLPHDYERHDGMHLKVLGGSLGLYRLSYDHQAVWTMKEDEWTKLMDINVPFLDFAGTKYLEPLCLMRNGKVLMLYQEQSLSFRFRHSVKVVLYDPVSNTKEDFNIRGISSNGVTYVDSLVSYVETLISPNSISRGV